MIYGLDPRDPATFALALGLLTTTGLFAGYLPARRSRAGGPGQCLTAGMNSGVRDQGLGLGIGMCLRTLLEIATPLIPNPYPQSLTPDLPAPESLGTERLDTVERRLVGHQVADDDPGDASEQDSVSSMPRRIPKVGNGRLWADDGQAVRSTGS